MEGEVLPTVSFLGVYGHNTSAWVYQLSSIADSRRLRFRHWRTAILPEKRSTASRKLAAVSSCWEQAHFLWSTNIQADEASERRCMFQVHAATLTAL